MAIGLAVGMTRVGGLALSAVARVGWLVAWVARVSGNQREWWAAGGARVTGVGLVVVLVLVGVVVFGGRVGQDAADGVRGQWAIEAFLAPAHLNVALDHPSVPGGILASGCIALAAGLIVLTRRDASMVRCEVLRGEWAPRP